MPSRSDRGGNHMKLDRTIVKEIRDAVGDGSRTAKFRLLARVSDCCVDLSRMDIRAAFPEVLKKHGRVPVVICVAATLDARKERLDYWQIGWAQEVLSLLPGWTPGNRERGHIDDGIHPTAICDYARSLIRCTTEE